MLSHTMLPVYYAVYVYLCSAGGGGLVMVDSGRFPARSGSMVTIGKLGGDQTKCTKGFRTVSTDTGKVW